MERTEHVRARERAVEAPSRTSRPGLTSVVIVAADSGRILGDAVRSVLDAADAAEVIVVDNASTDGEPERVAAACAQDARFRLQRNDRNLGFGAACNRGAAAARGDALLFLNPDCVIERGTIEALRGISARDPSLGLVGIDVLTPGGISARGNRRRDPTLRRALMSMSGLARFSNRCAALAGVEIDTHEPRASSDTLGGDLAVERVDAVSGACLYLPRRVFDTVGGFDESYFLHAEDLDLCRRVRLAGFGVAIAPALHAVHMQGTSSRHRPVFVSWHKHRSMWRYYRRHEASSHALWVSLLTWCGLWAHFALLTPLQLASAGLHRMRGIKDASC
ncbi:MAG TPA: glycosyltransferase family 2 protein [Rhodanobacteraceae bacterium]|nr:glycosyltransferase family 2 protein [Rhodanobacteraceae bacterium]